MTIRAILMGSYNSEGAKGIIGGSDRMAAIQAVAEAAGGSVSLQVSCVVRWTSLLISMSPTQTRSWVSQLQLMHQERSPILWSTNV